MNKNNSNNNSDINISQIPINKISFALFKLAIELRPHLLLVTFISSLLKSSNVLLTIWIPKIILDGFDKGWSVGTFLKVLLIIAFAKLIINYFEEITLQMSSHEQNIFSEKVRLKFSQKITKVKYELLEDPDSLDLKERAMAPIDYRYLQGVFNNLLEIFSAILTIVGITTILVNFSIPLFIIMTLISLIALLLEGKLSKLAIDLQQRLVPINRRYNYYVGVLNNEIHQKEHRLYNLSDLVIEKLDGYNKDIMDEMTGVYITVGNAQTISTFINVFSRLILYSYAGLRVLGFLGTKIGLGSFSILVGANENYSSNLTILGKSTIETFNLIKALEPIVIFLDLEEMEEDIATSAKVNSKSNKIIEQEKSPNLIYKNLPGKLKTLTFENVSFTYPKTDKKILDNISFTLVEGEILAIVGKNNAGKSTIVKLICRLFEPDSGRILWNGVDIREFSYSEYLDELACVFQDFKLFPLRIWENVASSWSEANIDTSDNTVPEEIEDNLNKVLEQVNLTDTLKKLPSGLNTWLEKSLNEDSTDFSGGQKQRLAISRAIYKDSSVAILDEPTAALDPLAESEVYGHFAELIKGKTAIFISHRMSASRFCDRIIVLDNGHITGNGSHNQLVKENELYKTLYESQAKYYE